MPVAASILDQARTTLDAWVSDSLAYMASAMGGNDEGFIPPEPLLIDGTVHPKAQRDPTRRVAVQINVVLNWFEKLRARSQQR